MVKVHRLPAAKKTQGERAAGAVSVLRRLLPTLTQVYDVLDRAVGEAQNSPPEGKADGTLTGLDWARYAAIAESLEEFLRYAKAKPFDPPPKEPVGRDLSRPPKAKRGKRGQKL